MLTSNPEGSWMLSRLVPHDLHALRMQHQHVVMITTIKATSSSTKWLEPTAAVARLPTGRWVPDSCTPSTTNDLSVQEKWKGVVLEPKCQGPHKHDCMFHTQLVVPSQNVQRAKVRGDPLQRQAVQARRRGMVSLPRDSWPKSLLNQQAAAVPHANPWELEAAPTVGAPRTRDVSAYEPTNRGEPCDGEGLPWRPQVHQLHHRGPEAQCVPLTPLTQHLLKTRRHGSPGTWCGPQGWFPIRSWENRVPPCTKKKKLSLQGFRPQKERTNAILAKALEPKHSLVQTYGSNECMFTQACQT